MPTLPSKGEIVQISTHPPFKGLRSNQLPSFSKDMNPDDPGKEEEKGHRNV
jgi:hypothetical protein